MARRDPTAVWLRKRKGKRGLTYGLRWFDPVTGQGRSEACGTDLAYARERRAQVRQELRDGMSGRTPQTPLDGLIERLPGLMAGKSPVHTVASTQRSLRQLRDVTGPRTLAAIDRAAVMDFKAKRLGAKAAPATVNKELREIRSALSYATDAGLLRANPLLRWKGLMIREPEKVVRVVEPEEFGKLLEVCEDPTFRALLIVAYRQGLRRNELINLRWAAVDLEREILHVVNVPEADEFTKSRKNRTVPMHPAVLAELRVTWSDAPKRVEGGKVQATSPHVFTWPDGRPLKQDYVSRQFNVLVTKAAIASCTLHDLRRSFSTLAQRAGVDKYTVKDLGGWSEVSVVERHYTGDVSEAHRRAMKRIAETA